MIGLYTYLNFYTPKECEEIINYFENNSKNHIHYDSNNTDFLNIDFSYKLPFKKIVPIEKNLNLKLNYAQIVKWPNNSEMITHKDGKINKNNHWTSICYLNKNYEGGRTYVVENNCNKYIDIKSIGSYLCFNSENIEHGVEKVKGIRYSLTAWYNSNV